MSYRSDMIHDAVYWPPKRPARDGQPTFADPVEIKCRWDDTATTIRRADGAEMVTIGSVLTLETLEERGRLKRGLLDDVTNTEDPLGEGAVEIARYSHMDDTQGKDHLNLAHLEP